MRMYNYQYYLFTIFCCFYCIDNSTSTKLRVRGIKPKTITSVVTQEKNIFKSHNLPCHYRDEWKSTIEVNDPKHNITFIRTKCFELDKEYCMIPPSRNKTYPNCNKDHKEEIKCFLPLKATIWASNKIGKIICVFYVELFDNVLQLTKYINIFGKYDCHIRKLYTKICILEPINQDNPICKKGFKRFINEY
ncbi:hypothetical protein [Dasineura jujubifolia toursvirus 2a]|nr:hypothetical protein [Dasineura jujubifolia toursvirus 2a]